MLQGNIEPDMDVVEMNSENITEASTITLSTKPNTDIIDYLFLEENSHSKKSEILNDIDPHSMTENHLISEPFYQFDKLTNELNEISEHDSVMKRDSKGSCLTLTKKTDNSKSSLVNY